MIDVKNLTFEYPGIRALDDVSFSTQRGEISALVGPNGAGKTTLLRCLAALNHPLSGSIQINGIDVLAEPRAAHRQVGYLSDFFGLYRQLTVRQCLTYMARAYNIAPHTEKNAVFKAAERLQIKDRMDVKVGMLSRGLSQRLAIAQAIVHEPSVLLLDEPASGLDPEARKSLSELFLELKAQGISLLVSSHILAELEEYSTSMLIVRHGKIIEHKHLSHVEQDKTVIVLTTVEKYPNLVPYLQNITDISDVKGDDSVVTFCFSLDKNRQHDLLKQLLADGVPVYGFSQQKINLQDAYLAHVNKFDMDHNQ